MELKLILTVCFVNLGLISGQPHIQTINQFQNLFDSIAKNDPRNSNIYNTILKQEVAKEQQAFDGMKQDIVMAQIKNSHKKRNFYLTSNTNENIAIIKRASNGERNSYGRCDGFEVESITPASKVTSNDLYGLVYEVKDMNACHACLPLARNTEKLKDVSTNPEIKGWAVAYDIPENAPAPGGNGTYIYNLQQCLGSDGNDFWVKTEVENDKYLAFYLDKKDIE